MVQANGSQSLVPEVAIAAPENLFEMKRYKLLGPTPESL